MLANLALKNSRNRGAGRMAKGETAEAGARVFISYSRKDSAMAEELRDALRAAGFNAYLDVHDIDPGEKWKHRLGDLIAPAEKIVFLISADSVASDICEWEIERAERLGKMNRPEFAGGLKP